MTFLRHESIVRVMHRRDGRSSHLRTFGASLPNRRWKSAKHCSLPFACTRRVVPATRYRVDRDNRGISAAAALGTFSTSSATTRHACAALACTTRACQALGPVNLSLVYFVRRKTTVVVGPPPDGLGTVKVNSSSPLNDSRRFCIVPSKFGNVLPFIVIVIS